MDILWTARSLIFEKYLLIQILRKKLTLSGMVGSFVVSGATNEYAYKTIQQNN